MYSYTITSTFKGKQVNVATAHAFVMQLSTFGIATQPKIMDFINTFLLG